MSTPEIKLFREKNHGVTKQKRRGVGRIKDIKEI